jgi:hypothetical protein
MSNFNLTDQTNLFKINYYKKSDNMYNSDNVLDGRMKKKYDFTGKQKFVATPLSFSGGVGSGVLPKSNAGNYEGASITAKRVYATCEVEREAIKASANDAGAFVRATAETVKKTVESYMRNCSRILFGKGDGTLAVGTGTGANVSGNGASGTPFVVEIPAASWVAAKFEEKDYLQMVSGYSFAHPTSAGTAEGGDAETNLLEVVEVDVVAKTISLVGTSAILTAASGSAPLATSEAIVMQRSFNREPVGLRTISDISESGVGSLYGINVQRRWQMEVQDAGNKGITVDRMNNIMLSVEQSTGKVPNIIMASFAQFQNILALLEDQKVYNLPSNKKGLMGELSFKGVEFMSTRGPVGIFVDRFCEDDRIYFLRDDRMERHHRPDFGWFDDDGTVFLRKSGEDNYEARYGGYFENFIIPTGHGVLKGLAV